jgi:Exo-beta-D-glucosaminidase Ig-fold domain/Malectin domain
LPEHQDDLQALNTMPPVTLKIEATRQVSAGKCLIAATVRNPTPSIALMTHLQLRRARSNQRVLPVFYSDNYLCLLPGETRNLSIEADAADLGGEEPLLAVDGWNATVNYAPVSGAKSVQVVPNNDAQVLDPSSASSLTESLGIHCGGGPVGFFRFGAPSLGVFARDWDFKDGNVSTTNVVIDTSAPNAAPAEVYQSERWGKCTYTLPVKLGSSYTVRLHFAETKYDAGQRKFSVDINGRRVLTDFDIAGEGGKNKAVVKDFPSINPDADGHIIIALSRGSANEPKICGIQILK